MQGNSSKPECLCACEGRPSFRIHDQEFNSGSYGWLLNISCRYPGNAPEQTAGTGERGAFRDFVQQGHYGSIGSGRPDHYLAGEV